MTLSLRSKIVKIGNSRGIRIPRAVLEQAGLSDEVEMAVEGGKLIISSSRRARQGWEASFAAMAARGDDRLLDEPVPTEWDGEGWEW